MKKFFFLILFIIPIFSTAQTQIGNILNGIESSDKFGISISLSSDGNTLAIGAPFANSEGTGSVTIYQNKNGIWSQLGDILKGISNGDYFGNSVSLSSDGNILAIGAPFTFTRGSVTIYQNQSGNWIQIGNTLNGINTNDIFGKSISLSSDGNTLAIGSPFANGNLGYVSVYQNQSGNWNQIGSRLNNINTNNTIIISVSLSSDGNILAVGAPSTNSVGSVIIYQNQSGNWIQIGNTLNGINIGDYFGKSISLSSDGNTLAVGAPVNNNNTGYVSVYKNNSGNWTQIGNTLNGININETFGNSVSLSSDGNILAIGVPSTNSTGSVMIYKNNSGVWTRIGSTLTGVALNSFFGSSVSLSSDGSIVAIGAYGENSFSGAVRIYDVSSVLNIADPMVNANFSIYPNPVKDHFSVKLNNTYILQKVSIYNILSQKILEQNTNTINTSKLSKGLYYVKVEINKGIGVKKIIIE